MIQGLSRQVLIGIITLLWAVTVLAQAPDTLWTKTYGSPDIDIGLSVCAGSDGGYVIAGYTGSHIDYDVFLIRTDADGDTIWTRTYGATDRDFGQSVQPTYADGGYIVAGQTECLSTGDDNAYLIKTDAAGDTLWTRTYGGPSDDRAYSVQQTFDGGYITAGETYSFGAGDSDVYLIRTYANGDTMWTRTYGHGGEDCALSVQQTLDGGYIIVGRTVSSGGSDFDVYLIKTDAAGDTIWTRTYGSTESNDYGHSVDQTADGGYVVGGSTYSFSERDEDFYLLKANATGDTTWTRTYGGPDEDQGRSVQQTSEGGYIIAGWTWAQDAGYYDIYLVKTDANGDTLWTKACGGAMDEQAYSVKQTSDLGYVVAGRTMSFGAGKADVYLIRLQPDCAFVSRDELSPPHALFKCSPNPFAYSATVSFDLCRPEHVYAAIYDIRGRLVIPMMDETVDAECHNILWDGTDVKGINVSPGTYFIRLRAGDQVATRKVVRVR